MTQKTKLSLQDALKEDVVLDISSEIQSDLKELFTKYRGDELVKAVITRVQRYAAEKSGKSADMDYRTVDSDTLETIRETTSRILGMLASGFLSDAHKELVVRCHARGLSTSDAIWELVKQDNTIGRLAQHDAVGLEGLKITLGDKLACLKPGSPQWSEKEYGAIWDEERERHKKEMRNIPLISPTGQAALLAKHAERINDKLYSSACSPEDWQLLTDALVKTLEGLRKVSGVEQQASIDPSTPRLVQALEQLTLTLSGSNPYVMGGMMDQLVGVLERLILVLQSTQHEAVIDEVINLDNDDAKS